MISKICGCVQSLLHTDLYNSSHRFVPSANWSLRVCFWPNACFWCPGLHRSLFQWIVRVSSKFNTRRTFVDLLINSLLLWSPSTGPLIVRMYCNCFKRIDCQKGTFYIEIQVFMYKQIIWVFIFYTSSRHDPCENVEFLWLVPWTKGVKGGSTGFHVSYSEIVNTSKSVAKSE